MLVFLNANQWPSGQKVSWKSCFFFEQIYFENQFVPSQHDPFRRNKLLLYVSIRRVQMPVRHLSWYQKVDNKDRFLELQQLQRSNILFLQPLRHTSFEATPPWRKTSGGALSRSSLLSAHLPNAITAAAFGWNLRFDNPFSWQHKREKSWKMAFGSSFLGWCVTLYERYSVFQRVNMIK